MVVAVVVVFLLLTMDHLVVALVNHPVDDDLQSLYAHASSPVVSSCCIDVVEKALNE